MFPSQKVNEVFSRPRCDLEPGRSYPHVFVIIDPAGGSDVPAKHGSDYALLSIVESPRKRTIVGIEAMDAIGRSFK